MSPGDFRAAVARVRAEFTEMPGLRLTPSQAARLMGLDQATTDFVIEALVQEQFLRRTSAGLVGRVEASAGLEPSG
jgi:hypothetical protein